MTIDFGSPVWLWLVAVIPAVWMLGRTRAAGWRTFYAATRLVMLTALIGALADPVLSLRSTRVAFIYLVDASHSLSARALTRAAEAIDAMNTTVHPDESKILAFGGRAATIPDTATLRRLATTDGAVALESLVAPDTTNLEEALAAARAEVPRSTNGRIVLFSDGRQTAGDYHRVIERLAAERVPVFTQAVPVRDVGDTWIADLGVLRTPAVGAVSTFDVTVGSQVARSADITLHEGSTVLARRTAAVAVGETRLSMDVEFSTVGPHVVEATVKAAGDALAENNALSREVIVEPRPRVLYVHTDAARSGRTLVAMTQAGLEVTTLDPESLPRTADAFDRWDVAILSDVARTRVSAVAMNALGSWVEERGGGLLMAGGHAVFGEDPDLVDRGYRRTDLERVLPVTFDRDDEPEVALVIVLDRSWSMYGPAMELSKTAAESAANALQPSHLLGILTFNDNFNWDVPVARVREIRSTLHESIGRITASGPTAIYPALEQAYTALVGVRARAKHVILQSDGQTKAEDFEGLVKKMAQAHITVSSIALGAEADATLLGNIAKWGGGRGYVVQQAEQVPEIFVKEAKSAGKKTTDDSDAIAPEMRRPEFFGDAAADVPSLYGRNVVTRKPQAIELIGTSDSNPLLTIWPAGLGRTAMFAADLDGQWTRDWMQWRGLGGFLATVVRSLAPRRLPARSLTVTPGDHQGSQQAFDISLDARDEDGNWNNLLAPAIDVTTSDARRATINLIQVGLGRYASHVVADTAEPIAFAVEGGPASASRVFVADRAAEYRFGPPDDKVLSAIASATGGTVRPSDDQLRNAPKNSGFARHPLAPWLLGLALLLWPVDIALRRFRK